MKRILRVGLYIIGLLTLTLGLSLNSQAGWGSAAIISIANVTANAKGISFGLACTVEYLILVLIQIAILRRRTGMTEVLQLFISFIMGGMMDFYCRFIVLPKETLFWRVVFVLAGVVVTGIGACIALNMRIAPGPADGFVQTISDVTGKARGTCKNVIDALCMTTSFVLSLMLTGRVIGVGLGTLAAVLLTGRVMFIFDKYTRDGMCAMVGVDPNRQLTPSPVTQEAG